MKVAVCALALASVLATAASAQDDAVVIVREAIMDVNSASADLLSGMMDGTGPFDAAVAKQTLLVIVSNMQNFQNLFPDDSKQNTSAKPEVWTNWPAFLAIANKIIADATAASATVGTRESLMASKPLQDTLADCNVCHVQFRGR